MKKYFKINYFICLIMLLFFPLSLTACDKNNDTTNDYIINFLIDESLYHNLISSGNESIDLPESPSKDGYSFVGWYFFKDDTEIEFTSDYLKDKLLTADLNLYAKFVASDLNVSLNLNGGTCNVNSINVTFGEEFNLPIPVKDGYDFDGWYNDELKIETDTWHYNATTLTAKWNKIFEISGNLIVGLTDYGKTLENINIPQTINGENILYIDSNAFHNCTSLKNLFVPATITEIGFGALSGCTNLRQLTIPFIGDTENSENTFGFIFGNEKIVGCTETKQSDKTYYIPNTLYKVNLQGLIVKDYSFSNCINITEININDNVENLGENAFYNCSSLESFTLPKGLTYLNDSLFAYCTNLKTVKMPNTIKTINSSVFYMCSNLKNININELALLENIGYYSFYSCESLEDIVISENVKTIGSGAFKNCYNVKNMYYNAISCSDFGSSYHNAFDNLGENTSGTNVYIGNKVKSIPNYLFETAISSPSSETHICNVVFEENSQCERIGVESFYRLNITNINIPSSVTIIGENAFSFSSLIYVVINNNYTTIDKNAFGYAKNLTSIYYYGTQEAFLNLSVNNTNEIFIKATKYYYSQQEPETTGNYWHYDIDNSTILIW